MNNKKNVWLIPTDKPSRLWINNLLQGKLELSKEVLVGSNTAQSIYITDDSEVKEGDWVFNLKSKGVYSIFILNEVVNYEKKIILTTDQDLIADGVQSINDEFLEWFCSKNGKVDFVEVEREKSIGYTEDRARVFYGKLKIIIPKEEPKQHLDYINSNIEEFEGKLKEFKQEQKQYLIDMMRGDEELGLYNELYNEPKQETIEEVAKKYSEEFFNRDEISMRNSKASYIDGAKSDAARDYWYNKFWEDYDSQFKKQNNEQ
jgi:hypothetical protein